MHSFDGEDVFLWLPTGFGKSLCYQLLPYLFDYKFGRVTAGSPSLVVVVCPLISLMVDQVRKLRHRGVKAAILTSSSDLPDNTLIATGDDLERASYLFSAPEAILGSKWRTTLMQPCVRRRIVAIAIDEAHCVSKW